MNRRSIYLAGAACAATWALAAAQAVSPNVSSEPITSTEHATKHQGNFIQGFVAALSVVIVSELGDKTFFIAAIMAMKHARLVVFAGAISALVFMTVIAAAFGWVATVIPRIYIHYLSVALFIIFGIKMLREGIKMNPNGGQEELEEVQMELKRREDQAPTERSEDETASEPGPPIEEIAGPSKAKVEDVQALVEQAPAPSSPIEEGGPSKPRLTKLARLNNLIHREAGSSKPKPPPKPGPSSLKSKLARLNSLIRRIKAPLREEKEETLDMLEQGQAEIRRRRRKAILKVFLSTATLTFLAEWGDRSQLATVVLATREDAVGVVVGGSLGHALCTGLAVIGGRMVAQKISVRTVTIIGGIVFLGFAVSALVIGPGD